MNKYLILMLVTLTGCTATQNNSSDQREQVSVEQPVVMAQSFSEISYQKQPLIKNVNHYAKWVVQDLLSNLDYPSNEVVFAITDLSLLDSDLTQTNHFGRQFSEAMIHEVNKTGFSVIDLKSSSQIRMNEAGDMFFQTEDVTRLSKDIPATNIISGTMARHQGGYLLNVRIIDADSNALVSSAQMFVPYTVIDAVLLEEPLPQQTVQMPTNEIAIVPATVQE